MDERPPPEQDKSTQRIEVVRRADGAREVPMPVEDLDTAFTVIAMLGWREST